MSKKLLSKVISIVLALTVCSTLFFGCVVSAADYQGTYNIIGAGYDPGTDTDYLTAEVTFQSANPFTAGRFTVESDELVLCDANIVTAVLSNGTATIPDCYYNVQKGKVLFEGFKEDATNSLTSYSSITFTLKFHLVEGEVAEELAGSSYPFTVEADFTDTAMKTYEFSLGAEKQIHIHDYEDAQTVGDVTTSTCSVCGDTKSVIADGAVDDATGTIDVEVGANVTFTNDGGLELNINANKAAVQTGGKAYFVSTSGMVAELDVVKGDFIQTPIAYAGGVSTIDVVVAGNVVVADASGNLTAKKAISYSIKQWCDDVINGEHATEDKDYCAALLNYSQATRVFSKMDAPVINGSATQYGELSYTPLTAETKAKISGTDANWKASSVNVKIGFQPIIRFKFKFEDAAHTSIKFAINGTAFVKEINAGNFDKDGDYYYYELTGIPAKHMRRDITVSATVNNDLSAKTVTYGLERYANSKMTGDDADAAKVCETMMIYSEKLDAKF